MSWPQFTFPFPTDCKLTREKDKRDRTHQSRGGRYTRGTWAEQAHLDVDRFLGLHAQDEFTVEDFKVWCLETLGRKPPHHGSVWGAIWMNAFKRKKIAKIGVKMLLVTSYKGRYKQQMNVWRCA